MEKARAGFVGFEEFAQKVFSQHYLVVYGDHRKKIESLCKILGIEII